LLAGLRAARIPVDSGYEHAELRVFESYLERNIFSDVQEISPSGWPMFGVNGHGRRRLVLAASREMT
jgi:hypothetical protein